MSALMALEKRNVAAQGRKKSENANLPK